MVFVAADLLRVVGVQREVPESPRPPATIASIISLRRGEAFILATLLFFALAPFCGLLGTRLVDRIRTSFLFPSAFDRAGRSVGAKVGSSLSVSESRVPKRNDTWILSSLRVLIGDLSPGPNLPALKPVELEGRVIATLSGGSGGVLSKFGLVTS